MKKAVTLVLLVFVLAIPLAASPSARSSQATGTRYGAIESTAGRVTGAMNRFTQRIKATGDLLLPPWPKESTQPRVK